MAAPLLYALEEHTAALCEADHIYVGFSGGKDSHSLLHALQDFGKHYALPPVTAIHVNHGLHPDASAWEEHCRSVASDLEIEIAVESVVVGSDASLEAQARNARYSVFERYLSKNTLLLLAHHLDDQVETLLFRLIRGAGPNGLSGMPQSRSLGAGKLLRPFLSVARSDIEHYASQFSLQSVNDPSNHDTSLDRNFLRHEVLPLIESRWPGYRQGFSRTGEIMTVIAEEAPDLWYQCSYGGLSLDLGDLCVESVHAAVHAKLSMLGFPLPSYDALKEFSRQSMSAGTDRTPSLSMNSYAVVCWRSRLQLIPVPLAPCELEEVTVGESISREWGTLNWVSQDHGLPVGAPVTLRQVEAGEKVRFVGRSRRPVRHCLQEAGIAPYWRSSIPMVCAEGTIMAVPGLGCTDQATRIFNKNSEALVPVWQAPKICIGN